MLLSKEQLILIEKVGVFFTESRMKPAAARINALLLVSDILELTFDEIRDILQLSKSATSNGLNFLLETNHIEYVTKPGDRKRYFRSKIGVWKENFEEHFRSLTKFHQLLCEIKEQRTTKTPDFNHSLEEIASFIQFAFEELSEIYKKWELKRK